MNTIGGYSKFKRSHPPEKEHFYENSQPYKGHQLLAAHQQPSVTSLDLCGSKGLTFSLPNPRRGRPIFDPSVPRDSMGELSIGIGTGPFGGLILGSPFSPRL